MAAKIQLFREIIAESLRFFNIRLCQYVKEHVERVKSGFELCSLVPRRGLKKLVYKLFRA